MANIIGLIDLNKHLATFKHITKIEVCEKETSKRAMYIVTKDTGAPVPDLLTFLEGQKVYSSSQFLPYYIKLYMKKDGAPGSYGSDPVGFTFAFEERDKNLSVNGPGAMSPLNQTQLYEMYRNNGFLEAENKRLQELLRSKEVQILELETELNAEGDDDQSNTIAGFDMSKIATIIGNVKEILPLIPSLFPQPQTAISGGGGSPAITDPELNNIIAELNMIDPLFKTHMNEYLTNYKLQKENGAGNN